ncbi:hypothetical protein B296_00058168 [Ensete ventricosum]|uniref:Uncharacterized protein n=1 Tax=Ensete ventricosum TaxID=4639 RepID=A0A426X2E4_ENSVE|nr:hypothetical protein B296_00058168 [Ensete ventricosum]
MPVQSPGLRTYAQLLLCCSVASRWGGVSHSKQYWEVWYPLYGRWWEGSKSRILVADANHDDLHQKVKHTAMKGIS